MTAGADKSKKKNPLAHRTSKKKKKLHVRHKNLLAHVISIKKYTKTKIEIIINGPYVNVQIPKHLDILSLSAKSVDRAGR